MDRPISRSLARKKFDLMHSTAYEVLTGFEHRTVMTIHDLIFMSADPYSFNRFRAEFMRKCLPKVAKIIAISRTAKGEILRYFPSLSEHKIEIVYQGVREDYWPVTDQEALRVFKREFFGDENLKYVLFLGTFIKRKNPLNLIRAYAELIKTYHVEHKLVLVGKSADMYAKMCALIESLGLKERVIIKDYIPDALVPSLLSGADVFCFLSYYEGFGLPVIEAMKCGCPCVVSNVSSLGELFSDAALAVDPDSPVDIAAAIYKLISDPVLREKYKGLGLAKAQVLNWKKTAEQTLAVYKSLA